MSKKTFGFLDSKVFEFPDVAKSNRGLLSEISGSHGGDYEDGCLLGYCAV
jgi:hypothetical protein